MKKVVEQILKQNGLSITSGRKEILKLFLRTNHALVHSQIEKKLYSIIDRISIYRTLQNFKKKGIIHSIPTTDGSIMYALSNEQVINNLGCENHLHFFCSRCHKTTCLSNVFIPEIKLPNGYEQKFSELVITGKCKNCK